MKTNFEFIGIVEFRRKSQIKRKDAKGGKQKCIENRVGKGKRFFKF